MKKPAKLALPDVPRACRDAVVTEARARWKDGHDVPSERVIRLLRFLWMREAFPWMSRNRLHGGTLGAALRGGYVERNKDLLKTTLRGGSALQEDRRVRG